MLAPVSGEQHAYAESLLARLGAAGLRARLDAPGESLGKRIQSAHQDGIPFVMVVGSREAEAGAISVRGRDGRSSVLPIEAAMNEIEAACRPPI